MNQDAPQPVPNHRNSGQESASIGDEFTTDPATTVNVPGAECPIRVGDEVTLTGLPRIHATVTGVFLCEGTLECAIVTPAGERGLVRPWRLCPADGASPHWRHRMRVLHTAQRTTAADLITRRHHELAARTEALAQQLAHLAEILRGGELPDPGMVAVEVAARRLDDDLAELRELCLDFTHADLLTPATPSPAD